ncbi:Phage capsid family protein [uncultured Clostridium sp.]
MNKKFIKYLRDLINSKKMKADEIRKLIKEAETADEVRALGDTLQAVLDELEEAKKQLEEAEKDGDEGEDPDAGEGEVGAERNFIPTNVQQRNGDIIGAYGLNNGRTQEKREATGFGSMEYRQAFMAYVQRGTEIPADVIARAGGDKGPTLSTELGAIIPETIMNEFIKEVSKVYGHIYAKVRKLNVRGGVKFPISKLKASFKWITETTVSDRQKAGDIKDFVTFEYNIGEIRVSETLLAQVVSLPLFESEITKIMVEAYVEAMDKGIISGNGNGQLLGITTDSRVTNVVEMTEAEFSDWTAWRKNLFAKIPLSKRGQGEFLFPVSTVETYLMTMKDNNDRPLWKDPDNAMSENGTLTGKFFGRVTDYVEPDVIKDFATAEEGDVVGIYWTPKDYAINTNMQFGMTRYFDHETNEWVNKGLTIVDGKILDSSGCYLIKKKNAAAAAKRSIK